MNFLELFVIAVGLSMDAFAASVCKGLSVQKVSAVQATTVGAYFGGFQALMPLIGYFLGSRFQGLITRFDHWIAFLLLGMIGYAMIKESRSGEDNLNDAFDHKTMLTLAVATSIDALVIGITFAALKANILQAVSLIGATTFVLSWAGIHIGNLCGSKYKSVAEIFGGTVLILLGAKILVQHLIAG